MNALPICCVTGRIAGDGFACGDCDPCSAAHTVPEAVKQLIKHAYPVNAHKRLERP